MRSFSVEGLSPASSIGSRYRNRYSKQLTYNSLEPVLENGDNGIASVECNGTQSFNISCTSGGIHGENELWGSAITGGVV